MSRTLVITQHDDGYYTAVGPDSVADKMQFDECLGLVSKWMIKPEEPMRYSVPIESYWQMERRLREKIERELRPVDLLLLREKRA